MELTLDATLAVRVLHVIAATLAVGIPVALALVVAARPEPEVVERLVTPAERAQWGALAVLVATGVGNLAAFEGNFPGGDWETVLFTKLGFVFALLVVSAVRTFVIAGLASRPAPHVRRLGGWYLATAGLGVLIVGLAEVLAHG